MRRAGLWMLVFALGLGAAWLAAAFGDSGGSAPIAGGATDRGRDAAGDRAGSAHPRSVEQVPDPRAWDPAAADPAPADPAVPPDPAGPATGAAEPGQGIARIEVFDRASRQPVTGFRYVSSSPDGERHDAAVAAAHVELTLPTGTPHELRVEADGYAPSEPLAVELAPAERRLVVRVELDALRAATGITFHLRRADSLAPVTRVAVRARLRALDAPASASPQPLWHRRAENADGVFDLPELPAGHLTFELTALDPDGRPAALLPVTHERTYYGSEQVPVYLDLQPAVRVALTVVDRESGEPLGREVGLQLVDARGQVVESRWVHRGDDGDVAAVDSLPVAERCELDRALPPGRYELTVRRGADGALERHALSLVLGRDAELRIAVGR